MLEHNNYKLYISIENIYVANYLKHGFKFFFGSRTKGRITKGRITKGRMTKGRITKGRTIKRQNDQKVE